jgi:hypothetical protein
VAPPRPQPVSNKPAQPGSAADTAHKPAGQSQQHDKQKEQGEH